LYFDNSILLFFAINNENTNLI